MPKKYFTAFCKMNSKDLRANFFHHSCLVFFEGECDEKGNLILPLYMLDAYGFYSHMVPGKKSFFEEPFTFLCQNLAGIEVRLRGSYGEWRQEAIHDLCYGRGLTGRLFEMNEEQFAFVLNTIKDIITKQTTFFPDHCHHLHEREAYYKKNTTEQTKEDLHAEKPMAEFKFSVTGRGYTCKNAGLDLIASCYDSTLVEMHKRIDALRGHPAINAVPLLTFNLDDIVIHTQTTCWEKRGDKSLYPFCDWNHIREGRAQAFVVSFSGRYIDTKGHYQPIIAPDHHCLNIIDALKTIGRLCEINCSDPQFRAWDSKINHYVYNIASCQNERQQQIRLYYADRYLSLLVNNPIFQAKASTSTPVNLRDQLEAVYDQYHTNRHDKQPRRVCC